jgi:hypothetical protein
LHHPLLRDDDSTDFDDSYRGEQVEKIEFVHEQVLLSSNLGGWKNLPHEHHEG